ncbi:hypothetical protein P3X46_024291 [Hevea brasiliensis]|nr:hypothetical protein P3X46_024291 [Hevea brasiliensis]
MAEQIPFSIAESLLTKLASFVSQEISLVYGFTKDLRRLESTLSSINAILLDAEKKQEESHAVKVWIKRLREVVYDADDLLDDVATEGLRRKVEIQGRMVRKGWWRTWKDAEPLPQFACLSQLIIVDCPNLTLMPTFPSLEKELWLCNANIRPLDQTLNVKMMGATASALPSTSSSPSSSVAAPLSKLKSLVLEGIENVASLPGEWMRNLTSIEYLQISRCPNLTSLPKEMCHITTLQELNIDHCPHLSERCGHHEAADWSNIAHIPNIVIDGRDIQKEGCYLLEEEGSSSSTEQE